MNIDLISDSNLRGVMFENAARVLLRRRNKNNFIFGCRYFDSVDEIITKYRIDCSSNDSKIFRLLDSLRHSGLKGDLIEFVLDDLKSRRLIGLNFYDVKSKILNAGREYFDVCVSDFEFMDHMNSIGGGTFIVPIIMNYRWAIGFEVIPFIDAKIRVYNSVSGKTAFLLN